MHHENNFSSVFDYMHNEIIYRSNDILHYKLAMILYACSLKENCFTN